MMDKIKHLMGGFFGAVLLLYTSGCNNDIPGGSGVPIIEFTYVPPYESFENLKGQVQHVKPAEHRVAVYIYVSGGWWTKPYWSTPLTPIQDDGSWVCDITTGGIDEKATKIVAYLVREGYDPPLMSGEPELPPDLKKSLAKAEVSRRPEGRTISFSGYEWAVKSSETRVGPGPNYFSDSGENVWVDEQGRLHLKITKRDGSWYCAEVISAKSFGYGRYIFYLSSRVDKLNENVAAGLFTWSDAPEYNHREIDVEFSRWGQPANDNAQFVVQPWNNPGNIHRFNIRLNADHSTHSFDWRRDRVYFQSVQGHYSVPPGDGSVIESWEYTGEDIPKPGGENARINLWLFEGRPPSDRTEAEIVIKEFEFVP